MALLFVDGFDHSGTLNPGPSGATKWGSSSSSGGTVLASTAVVRTGSSSLRIIPTSANQSATTKPFTTSGGAIVGVAVYFTGTFTATDIIQITEISTVHMTVAVTTGGQLVVKRGATILATGTTVLSLSSWYHIEFKTIIHDTTGSYEVRIDGVTEAALTNAGPTDTRNAGTTGQWDRVTLGIFLTTNAMGAYFDDFYLCDDTGSAPTNTFLGAVKIDTLLPQTDAVAVGSNTGLTPSTGTDHGALVDENPPNTTDYNSSATVGIKDTYNYPAMALTGTVIGIQTNLYVQKSDAVARSVCAVVRTNSLDFDGANVSPLTTFAYFSEIRALNPDTGVAWTTSDISTIQAGMKVTV